MANKIPIENEIIMDVYCISFAYSGTWAQSVLK